MAGALELDPTPQSVRQAREWAREQVVLLQAPGVADAVGSIVTELVSNVVLHARTSCAVTVDRHADRLRVEVSDSSPRPPSAPSNRDPMAQSGRGMQLVASLSAAHGSIDHGGAGKTVWAEVFVPAKGDRP